MTDMEFFWTVKEPTWFTCGICNNQSSQEACPCVAMAAKEKAREQREKEHERELIRGYLPAAFRWVLDTPELLPKRMGVANPEATIGPARSHWWTVFQGPAGSGKTTAAAALLAPTLTTFSRVLWADSYQLARAQLQHPAGQGEAPLVKLAKSVQTLVLDDLGSEPKGVTSCVPDVIFERHQEEMTTIITTGFGAKKIADMYGDGIARRVFERALLIKLGGGQ